MSQEEETISLYDKIDKTISETRLAGYAGASVALAKKLDVCLECLKELLKRTEKEVTK